MPDIAHRTRAKKKRTCPKSLLQSCSLPLAAPHNRILKKSKWQKDTCSSWNTRPKHLPARERRGGSRAQRQEGSDRHTQTPYIKSIIRILWRFGAKKLIGTTRSILLIFQMRKLRPWGIQCLEKGYSTCKHQNQERNLNFLIMHFTEIPAIWYCL